MDNSYIYNIIIENLQRLLQRSQISPDDNFFDLGGDSLIAARLFLEIEQETGRRLPVTTINDAPTAAKLADAVGSAPTPQFSTLVLLKPGDARHPLFIVHGLGGYITQLLPLGKSIESRHAVYGIQARGLDGESAPCETVEEMAQLYVDVIREVQPRGPYFLAGYSFGGLVAMEMAHRLSQAGEKIAFLAFLDSCPDRPYWPLISRLTVLRRITEHRAAKLLKTPPRAIYSHAITWLRRRFGLEQVSGPSLLLPVKRVSQAHWAARARYRPRYYDGTITFFRAKTFYFMVPENPARIWRKLSREFELHLVPGDHWELMLRHVGDLAAELSPCLLKAHGHDCDATSK
ncbi:alpha/beta fold hydrolase [Methylocapsa polymorpha]|uniref:Alpha/beta fold hydrolase n=1 Tax=Methylocapsa polymorpha TaxID=3080828 RepID=A0ABZ0HWK1_9HYPH|nr:alpha/beta fold hydrolase [Methylocapsa sp. RX1]